MNTGVMQEQTRAAIDQFSIKATGPDVAMSTLSGGNQQKVVLARELALDPKLLLAAQPTRGLDVGAAEYVHERLLSARDSGMAIMLISTELEEVLALSDRIMVMYEGKSMGLVDASQASREMLGLMMAGVSLENIENGMSQ
jgi:simple sugar transport system ATP-binding protein